MEKIYSMFNVGHERMGIEVRYNDLFVCLDA